MSASRWVRAGGVVAIVAALLVGTVAWLNVRGEDALEASSTNADATASVASAELIARGAYLARAGNCQGCHTERDGAAYAGGRGVPTPFGTVFAPNLTPDAEHGLGRWTASEFWRALHNGRARDGRLLYPAFPYPNYTRVTRSDSDAIFAYLRSLQAVAQPNLAHTLSFPFDQQAALAVWRALYFRAAERPSDTPRGAYLVEALGHCNACHASRNLLGATTSPFDLAGGLIPVQNWYAPSLASPLEAGVHDWSDEHVVALLRSGVSARGAVMGPMSEVVAGSTSHLNDPDLRAMAGYLKALPIPTLSRAPGTPNEVAVDGPGAKLFANNCAACHGEHGEGVAGIYPALAGSRAVTLQTPANLVHIVLEGGFPPTTADNPRPFGMPPFATVLSNDEVAQLLSFVRGSWGNQGAPVSALQVTQFRTIGVR